MIKKIPFLVAEISANHCGNLNLAKKLIKCAKKNNANAVKLQTYTADTMTIKSNKKYFKIKSGLWKNYNLWELYNEAHTPLQWHKDLFNYGKKIGITVFSTPFDETAVDFLEKLKCPIYKVASFEMTDIPLIKKIALTKKPMIISTGMANIKEIELAFKTAKRYGAKDVTLLYCVSNYPSKISDFNLNNIKILKDKFKCRVGLSDHTKDEKIAVAAVAAGAEVIEKHIALDNQKKGLDIKFSLKGKKIKLFSNAINKTYRMLGNKKFYRNKSEEKSKLFRRSIFAVKNIKKGDKFNKNNIKRIRPGHGLPPMYYEKLINKKSPFNLYAENPLKKNILKKLKIL
ncbi:MAG: pseudaminic acid synthase [Candidatus Pelagibacterales bacterium]|nr:MAG: pseudaminic acid synthase [Pelagibacterales bacterium]